MITENISTLKIHKLTKEQYDREYEAGNIDEHALYLTPEEEIDLTPYALTEQVVKTYETKDDSELKLSKAKAYADKVKSDIYGGVPNATLDTLTELATAFEENAEVVEVLNQAIANKSDVDHVHSFNDLEDKPFGEEEALEVLVPETSETSIVEVINLIDSSNLIIGDTYLVTVDGEKYECIAYEDEFDAYFSLGDSRIYNSELHPEEVPFFISSYVEDGASYGEYLHHWYFLYEDKATHTIKVEKPTGETTVKQLDEKFIPETIALKSDVSTLATDAINAGLQAAKESGEFKGEKGDSGVYVGSGDMPDGYNIQIDLSGETVEYVTKKEFNEFSSTIAGNTFIPIRDKVSGNNIIITDSAKAPLKNLKLFGKSEQNEIKGNQLLPYPYSDTTKTTNGLTYLDEGDGWISVSGTSTDKTAFNLATDCILDVNNGDEVTVSIEIVGSVQDLIVAGWSSTWGTFFESNALALGRITTQTGKISSNAIRLQIYTNEIGVTFNGKVRVMINKGSTALPYEPYSDNVTSPSPNYPQVIKSIGDDGFVEFGVYGKNLHPSTLGRYDRINETGAIVEHDGIYNHVSHPVNFAVPVGKTLTVSHNHIFSNSSGVVKLMQYDKNGVFIGRHEASAKTNKITLTPYNGCRYMGIVIYDSGGVELEGLELQLEIGSTATSYEPYNKQSLTIQIPNGLPGIRTTDSTFANYTDAEGQMWIADEIDFERGKYIQRIYTQYLPTEYAFKSSSSNRFLIDTKNLNYPPLMASIGIMSDVFLNSLDQTAGNNTIMLRDNGYVSIGYDAAKTVDEFKSDLINTPITIMYPIATPLETDLTEEQISQYKALTTNYSNTTILSDTHTEVEYIADTKKYIDKKFAELASALV